MGTSMVGSAKNMNTVSGTLNSVESSFVKALPVPEHWDPKVATL